MLQPYSYTFLFFRFLQVTLLLFISLDISAQKEKKQSVWKSLLSSAADTASDDYYGDNTIRYENYVYKPNIKTVQLYSESFELSQPLLALTSTEKLKLSFDDLDADLKNYSYTLIHCNANWEPSDLVPAEYIDGFMDNNINDYRYSFNTLQKFTHYTASFPNNSLRITRSGNYILKVYVNSNPDDLVLTRRFMIHENILNIVSRVTQASVIEDRNYKQELDFTINHAGYEIKNPYNDLNIVITQK
jgi:hypothetical protein